VNVPRFNRHQPYAEVWGSDNGARYAQNGHQFDGGGRWIPPDGGPPITLADEITKYDAEQDAAAAAGEWELRGLCRIWDRDWSGVEEARRFFFQTNESRR
jgi:hypothetical protein